MKRYQKITVEIPKLHKARRTQTGQLQNSLIQQLTHVNELNIFVYCSLIQ